MSVSLHTGIICKRILEQTKRDGMKPLDFTRAVAYPGIFFGGGGGSTNSAEDRGQIEGGSGGSSPLVRGFTQFVIERNPYSD
jgi:hypothetical protein